MGIAGFQGGDGVGLQFDILTPGTFLTPGGFATMGFGAPAAVGAKIARPDRVVVSLVGDGGFGQNPAVLATAREQNVPVVWVVMNKVLPSLLIFMWSGPAVAA